MFKKSLLKGLALATGYFFIKETQKKPPSIKQKQFEEVITIGTALTVLCIIHELITNETKH